MDISMITTAVIVAVALLAGMGSRLFLKDDNVIEEVAEQLIKDKTGVDIDLSPNSPEDKHGNK